MELSFILLGLAIIFSILGIIAGFSGMDEESSLFTFMGLFFAILNMLLKF